MNEKAVHLDGPGRPSARGQCRPNLQAATRVAANDKPGRERLCRYILRPPLANDRLSILDDGNLHLEFKRPWSDGTSSVELAPLALIARLAALVPPPRRHLTRYCGVLSSHARLRSQIVPKAPTQATATATEEPEKPARKSKYSGGLAFATALARAHTRERGKEHVASRARHWAQWANDSSHGVAASKTKSYFATRSFFTS